MIKIDFLKTNKAHIFTFNKYIDFVVIFLLNLGDQL